MCPPKHQAEDQRRGRRGFPATRGGEGVALLMVKLSPHLKPGLSLCTLNPVTPSRRGSPQGALRIAALSYESKARALALWVLGQAVRATGKITFGFLSTFTCLYLWYIRNFSRETDQLEGESHQLVIWSSPFRLRVQVGEMETSLQLGREACPENSSFTSQLHDNETHLLRR